MAPEFPADLVVLDLIFAENGELKANVETIERTPEARMARELIHVSWNADKKPTGFFSVGSDAVYVRDTPKTVRYSYTAELDKLPNLFYSWHYNTVEPLMMVLVFPEGHIPAQYKPNPVRAKVLSNSRLAVYWAFLGTEKDDPGELTFRLEKSQRNISEIAAHINESATRTQGPSTNALPVIFDPVEPVRQDRLAVWVFGILSLVFLMLLVFFGPSNLSSDYKPIVRFVAALAGGLLSYFYVGKLHLGGKIPGISELQIAAVGGFAVFIFVMIFWTH